MVARLTPEIEQGRRLPAELVSALKSARIYGMLVPRRYRGLELDPSSAFRVVTALAKLEGSVGWNAMIGNIAAPMPFLASPALVEQVYQDGKDHILAVLVSPSAPLSGFSEDGGLAAHGRSPAGVRTPSGSRALA